MTISRFSPPLDYLEAASRASLQSFELTRLNHAANLRNEIAALIDQWIQETSEALLARWMLDHHKSSQPPAAPPPDLMRTLINSTAALLPEAQLQPGEFLPAPPRFAEPRPALKSAITRKPQKPRQSATG